MSGKYSYWISEHGLLKIKQWAKSGLNNTEIAENMGINYATFYRWVNRFSVIKETLFEARIPKEKYTKPKPKHPATGHKDTPELRLEREFKTRVESLGGVAYKLTIREHNGIPDRMVTFPGGHIGFVEVKRPDGKGWLRPTQKREIQLLRDQGQDVYILDSYEGINDVISSIREN